MRFLDLVGGKQPKVVGSVTQAEWDPSEHGIRFMVQFEPSGRRLQGVCRAGSDPLTGTFITETEMRAKLKRFREIKVYEDKTGGDPNTMSAEDFKKLTIEFSLSTLSMAYRPPSRPITSNSFLSRILR